MIDDDGVMEGNNEALPATETITAGAPTAPAPTGGDPGCPGVVYSQVRREE